MEETRQASDAKQAVLGRQPKEGYFFEYFKFSQFQFNKCTFKFRTMSSSSINNPFMLNEKIE
jgi:hypothetical protein